MFRLVARSFSYFSIFFFGFGWFLYLVSEEEPVRYFICPPSSQSFCPVVELVEVVVVGLTKEQREVAEKELVLQEEADRWAVASTTIS